MQLKLLEVLGQAGSESAACGFFIALLSFFFLVLACLILL